MGLRLGARVANVGSSVGDEERATLGTPVSVLAGANVGTLVSAIVGTSVGVADGIGASVWPSAIGIDGGADGASVGGAVGAPVGKLDGARLGTPVAVLPGEKVGTMVGGSVGRAVGAAVGRAEGANVGWEVTAGGKNTGAADADTAGMAGAAVALSKHFSWCQRQRSSDVQPSAVAY